MTNPVYTQNSFRIRSGDTVGLNVDSGWAALENIDATIDAGRRWRLRIHFEETIGKGGQQGFKLQGLHAQGSNVWTTLVIDNTPAVLGPAIPRLSLQFTDGAAATELLTNQGSAYEDGEGDDVDNAAIASPDATETECEWCILIPRYYYDGSTLYSIDDGDTIQFRVVESDDTAFDVYSNTPTITVNHPDRWLGGTYGETVLGAGPHIDNDGNQYQLQEYCEINPDLVMMKSSDGGIIWTPVDEAGLPSGTDWEGACAVNTGTHIHILHHKGDDILYHQFAMSAAASNPDTWRTTDESLETTAGADLQVGTLVLRSTEIVAFYQMLSGGNEGVYYKKRDSLGDSGTWDTTGTEIDTTSSINFYSPNAVKEIGSEIIHIFYKDQTTGDIYHKSLNASDTLSDRELVEDDAGTSTNREVSMTNAVAWQNSGDEYVMVVVQDESDRFLYSVIVMNDGSPETRRAATSVAAKQNGSSGHGVQAALCADGEDVYLVYAQESDGDIYMTKSVNDGVWDSPIELEDEANCANISILVHTHNAGNGGATVVAYTWDDHIGAGGYSGDIWYNEYELAGDTVDDLDAVGITTTPVTGTPAIGQTHALSAAGITANPILDTPSIDQTHALDAVDITANPVLDTPPIVQIHALSAVGITANPVLDTPTIGQEHALSAVDITADPTLDTSALAQEHALNSVGVTTTPILGTPTLTDIGQTHALDAVSITVNPLLSVPSIAQEHVLDAVTITANPILDASSIGQKHVLDAVTITANPILDASSIGQEHALDAVDITANPILDTSSIGQKHVLDAVDITANPVLDIPAIGQEHVLDAVDITANPILDTPSIGQEHALDAVDITADPVLGTPVLGSEGTDDLEANDITITSVVGTPVIGQEHVLDAVDITANPILDTPTVSLIYILDATGIETTPVVGTPVIGQIHALSSTGIVTTPEVGTSTFGQSHTLDASGCITTPVLEVPAIGQIQVLDAVTVVVSPILDVPLAGQTHILDAVGITTTPEMGVASFELVDGKIVIVFSAYQPEVTFSAYQPELDFTIAYTED